MIPRSAGANHRRIAFRAGVETIVVIAVALVVIGVAQLADPAWRLLADVAIAPCVLLCLVWGGTAWSRYRRALHDADGEACVAEILEPLRAEGWQILYELDLPEGDAIDVFLRSPRQRLYTIEVESARGIVIHGEDEQLALRRGWRTVPLNQDIIVHARTQARRLASLQPTAVSVSALIVFSHARVQVPHEDGSFDGVVMCERDALLRHLAGLEQSHRAGGESPGRRNASSRSAPEGR